MKNITDIELLDWSIKKAGEKFIDQKNNQARFCEAINQSHQVVNNWRMRNKLPNGWRAYLLSQYIKTKK